MPSLPEASRLTEPPAISAAARIRFRLRPAPNREPPFDDESAGWQLASGGGWDQQLPFAVRQPTPSRVRLTGDPDSFEPLPTARDDLPDPGGFARRFVIAVIEAATGRRAASQLGSHTSPGVQAGLVRDAGRISRLGTASRPATLHSMRLVEPADGVVEAAATVRVGTRYRAIAFRLEGLDGRWRCVRLQIG
ncbi:MAG: Rv3235 family protein [Jatrophihabitantaceae bacterium]